MKSKETKLNIFNLSFPDMDQMDSREFDSWFSSLAVALNTLEPDQFLKFSFLKGKTYLETTVADFTLPQTGMQKIDSIDLPYPWGKEVYSNIVFKDDYFKINGNYFRLINIQDFPAYLDTATLCDFGYYFLNFKKIQNSTAKKILDLQRKMHHANDNKDLRNLESENAKSQSENLMEKIVLGEESLFLAESWLLISAKTEKWLQKKTKTAVEELKNLEFTPFIEDIGLSILFPALLPGNLPTWLKSNRLPTSYLINCLPLKRDFLHEEGITFHSNDLKIVKLDIFNPASTNFNCLISGHSGSGKSVLAQKITQELIQKDVSTLILDRGGSFLKLTKYHQGNLFHENFNPLQFKSPQYLTEFILSVIPAKERDAKFEGKLLKIIKKILENEEYDNFELFLEKIEAFIPDISLFFEEILPYLRGKTTHASALTYVDTQNYPDKILPPLIIFLIEYFKDLKGKKVFVFDECWHLLEKNTSYIGECFRTFRKQGASAIAITQMYTDFLEKPIGRAIIQNSFYKFIFSQDLKEDEYFSSHDVEKIKSLKSINGDHSQFYLKTPFNKKIIRYYQTPLEYELFTSNFEENQKFYKFHDDLIKHFDFREIIEKWQRIKYA
jgi:type IV secretory pathway VirB4 component